MAKVDISKYLRNNRITDQSLIDMANRDRIDPMDTYASIFAANTGSNVDDSVLRAMSDYYTKNPVGEKTRANVEQYGVSERDFLSRLDNFRKNYTASVGPSLQNRINANARGMEPTSLQNEPTPTSAAAPSLRIQDAKNVGQALRYAGEGGISKQELNQISKTFDKTGGSIVQRLDKANQNIRAKGNTGINLNAGAANMLIRQQTKQSPTGYDAYLNRVSGGSPFGSGRIGSVLQARSSGTGVLGKPGNLMTLGDTIRPGGREAAQGFGRNQYKLPNTAISNNPNSNSNSNPTVLPGNGGSSALPTAPVNNALTINPQTPAPVAAAPQQSAMGSNFGGGFGGSNAPGIKRRGKSGAAMKRQSLGASAYNRMNIGNTGVNI